MMMTPLALFALLALAPEPVTIGRTVQLHSRRLFIATPAGYDQGTDRYPVLYLLDGETHFRYTAAIADFLAADDRIPGMLVVGIASGDTRTRDLTPPSTNDIDNRFSPGNGGAEAFLAFLAGDLIPYVERTYRTRPYRLLAGHSFGGLFAIYALGARPELFQGYIAADPSLHWNNGAVAAHTASVLAGTPSLQADLYLTATGSLAGFTAALAHSTPAGFHWKFDFMPGESHASVMLPTIHRGLETIFEPWRLPDPLQVFDRGGIQAIHRRFREAGQRFGYPGRTAPPFTVSLVVAALLRAGRLEDAGQVLLHDPAAYPPPWNQLDALARACEKCGDKEQAARYYRLSLERNPANTFAAQRLAEMGVRTQKTPPPGR